MISNDCQWWIWWSLLSPALPWGMSCCEANSRPTTTFGKSTNPGYSHIMPFAVAFSLYVCIWTSAFTYPFVLPTFRYQYTPVHMHSHGASMVSIYVCICMHMKVHTYMSNHAYAHRCIHIYIYLNISFHLYACFFSSISLCCFVLHVSNCCSSLYYA